MKEIVIEFIGSPFIVYSMYFYLFLLILYIVYSTFNYFKYYSRMKKTLQSIYTQMEEQERARAKSEKHQREIHGEGVKQDLLSRIDIDLAYSGIKDNIKWLTTELYIMIVAVTTAIVTTITVVVAGLWQGALALVITIAIFKVIISVMANLRDKKTEQQLLQFMNIIDNFSKTSDDLIEILSKAARYIDDPLSTQIYDAVQSAKNTGDALMALQDLQDNVKNKHFKILIRNLETSSHYENNFSDIIEDCRGLFHEYIRSQKEKRSIRMNGVIEIGTMVGTGLVSVTLIGNMTEHGNIIDTLLNTGNAGIILLYVLVTAIAISIYIAVFKILRAK